MLRSPAIGRPSRGAASGSHHIPAPTGGLNALDGFPDMPPDDALVLDNFFPQPDNVELRKGHESWATGVGSGAVESVMQWAGPTSNKLFAAKSTDIYDVSNTGAVGAAAVSSLSNGRWQHVMQTTSGGQFLMIANGADSVRAFDGSSWSTPTITGVSSSTLSNVWMHKERVWFIEGDSLSAWYLGTQAISGAASEYPLGAVFDLGGYLVAGGTMTRDGGNGPDDFCVFVTSRGEVAIYQGTDPSDSAAWSIVGVFRISPPIGKRCLQKTGGDLAVITESGVISLTAMLVLDRAAQQKAAVTSKINKLFTDAAQAYNAQYGWQVISYPRNNQFIVNIPVSEGSTQHQYVMNGLTGAWCRFTGLNANCWELYGEDLYFGGNDGKVYKADSTRQDDGNAITGDIKTAFSHLGSKSRVKTAKMMRALYTSNGTPGVLMGLDVDYADNIPTSSPTSGAAPGTVWGTDVWGTGTWVAGNVTRRDWVGATGEGTHFSVRMRVTADGMSCDVNEFDVLAENGGMI